jgi:aminoglycoside phosphotransferase (APT) family kinase protein
MARGLRNYLPGGDRITGVRTLSAGHSNETYLIEGLDRILRMPPSAQGLLPPYDMPQQHAVLAAVRAHSPDTPVPQVFELCTDPAVIGDAFFVMERLDGESFEYTAPSWLTQAPASIRDRVCRQWFDAIISLHRMPRDAMPTGGRSVDEEAAYWKGVAAGADADPKLIELLDDLVRKPPRTSGDPSPVHGDPKHGNCLWSGGQLTALLDWEMAQVSEPLLDLGYILMFHDQGEASLANAGFDLPGWWSRSRMIEEWERGTGRTAVDVARYEVLGQAKVTAIIQLGYHLFRSGKTTDKRFEGWGSVLPSYSKLLYERAAGS